MSLKAKASQAGKAIMVNGKMILVSTAGTLIARKFLDFEVLFKNNANDGFWGMVKKHQGLIKFIVALGASSFVKNQYLKQLLYGVSAEGAIRAIRAYGGGKFFEQIGEEISGAEDAYLSGLLEGLSAEERNELLGAEPITAEYPSTVGAEPITAEYPSTVGDLTANDWSGVGVADVDLSGTDDPLY